MSEINVYLKNNEAKECCFFTYNYLEHKIDENLISKGCYKFSVGKNNYKPQNKMFHFCKTFCSKITLVNTIQNVI